MQPSYPYEPGTVANDWRNVIYGSLAGAAPSNSVGVDGNYFLDIDTALVWGPKNASAWPGSGVSLFHGLNVAFGATNGAAPSNTIGVDGDMFVDYQTSGVFGPKASGAWPGTPVASLIGPANVVFGNSAGVAPSNSIGLNGFYFFDTSTSEWYGPKASGAWPPTAVMVAGGVNVIFGASGGAAPSSAIGIVGSYFYDTVGQLYYGPKTSLGWPSSGSYLSPVGDANTLTGTTGGNVPGNTRGNNGDYFLDGNTGKIFGPKAGGAWPAAALFTPSTGGGGGGGGSTSDGNVLSAHTSGAVPSNSIGTDGDYFVDADSGKIWGPKAAGAWPASPSYAPQVIDNLTPWENLEKGAFLYGQWEHLQYLPFVTASYEALEVVSVPTLVGTSGTFTQYNDVMGGSGAPYDPRVAFGSGADDICLPAQRYFINSHLSSFDYMMQDKRFPYVTYNSTMRFAATQPTLLVPDGTWSVIAETVRGTKTSAPITVLGSQYYYLTQRSTFLLKRTS